MQSLRIYDEISQHFDANKDEISLKTRPSKKQNQLWKTELNHLSPEARKANILHSLKLSSNTQKQGKMLDTILLRIRRIGASFLNNFFFVIERE